MKFSSILLGFVACTVVAAEERKNHLAEAPAPTKKAAKKPAKKAAAKTPAKAKKAASKTPAKAKKAGSA
jgi:hypothetical protein